MSSLHAKKAEKPRTKSNYIEQITALGTQQKELKARMVEIEDAKIDLLREAPGIGFNAMGYLRELVDQKTFSPNPISEVHFELTNEADIKCTFKTKADYAKPDFEEVAPRLKQAQEAEKKLYSADIELTKGTSDDWKNLTITVDPLQEGFFDKLVKAVTDKRIAESKAESSGAKVDKLQQGQIKAQVEQELWRGVDLGKCK